MYPTRRMWVHPFNTQRETKSEFINVYRECRRDPEKFFQFFRMSVEQFDNLHALCYAELEKKSTNYRDPLTPEYRLALTLT